MKALDPDKILLRLFFAASILTATTTAAITAMAFSKNASIVWFSTAALVLLIVQCNNRSERLAMFFSGLLAIGGGLWLAGAPLTTVALRLCANFCETVIALFLIRVWIRKRIDFSAKRDIFIFALACGVVAPLIASAISVFALSGFSGIGATAYAQRCLSHLIGTVIVVAGAVAFTSHETRRTILRKIDLAKFGFFVAVQAVTLTIFTQSRFPLLFLAFPALILSAFRLGLVGTTVSILFVVLVGTTATVHGFGPVVLVRDATGHELRALVLQSFFAACVFCGLPVALILRDRNRLFETDQRQSAQIRENNERFRQLERYAPIGLATVALDGTWLTVNPALAALIGYSEEELLSKTFQDITHPDDLADDLALVARLLADEIRTYQLEKRYYHKNGSIVYILLSVSLVRDVDLAPLYFISQIVDITQRKLGEALLEAENLRRAYFTEATRVLQHSESAGDMIDALTEYLIPQLGDICIAVIFDDVGIADQAIVGVASNDKLHSATLRNMLRFQSRDEVTQTLALVDEDLSAAQAFTSMRNAQPTAIVVDNEILGILLVGREGETPYDENEKRLLRDICERIGFILRRTRLYVRERRLARELQQTMLPPSIPSAHNVGVDAIYLPASRDADIGGDWYDAFMLPDGRYFVSVGDVAGHGLNAAGAMGKIRQMIRAFALANPNLGEIVRQCDSAIAFFEMPGATAICGIFDAAIGDFTYVQAGHPALVGVSADGRAQLLNDAPRTLPLGLIGSDPIPIANHVVTAGARIIAYTDGILEYNRDVIEGERVLCSTIEQIFQRDVPAGHPAETIVRCVLGETPPRDDVAMLILSAIPADTSIFTLQAPATPANLRSLRHRLSAFSKSLGIVDEQLEGLEIAIGEALTNVLEHAYRFDTGEVSVHCSKVDERVIVEIADHGQWREARDEGRGHGLRVMREFCADVHVTHGQSGTKVTLIMDTARVPLHV